MLMLNATKTKMYALAKAYIPDLPPMRQMSFSKTPRTRSWWLESYEHKVYLSAGFARGVLMDNGKIISRLSAEELCNFGLVKEAP